MIIDLDGRSYVDPVSGKSYGVRHMTLQDVDQVVALEKRLFTPPWSRASFLAELDERPYSLSLVAMDEATLIGYMVVYFIFEEAHLANLAIAPEYQHRGLGEHLLRLLIRIARQTHRQMLLLEVRRSNAKAIRLYEKMGFVHAGVRRKYYEDGEDALLMCKTLTEEKNGSP